MQKVILLLLLLFLIWKVFFIHILNIEMSKVKSRHRCISLMNGNWYETQHTTHDGKWYDNEKRTERETESVKRERSLCCILFCIILWILWNFFTVFFCYWFGFDNYHVFSFSLPLHRNTWKFCYWSANKEKMKQVYETHWVDCRCRFSLLICRMSPYPNPSTGE